MNRPGFLNPFSVVLALLHAYIGMRLLAGLDPVVQGAGVVLIAACFALLPKAFGFRGERPWQIWVPWIMTGFFSSLLVLTIARDVALLALAILAAPPVHDAWLHPSALAVLVLAPLATGIGYLMARRVAPVRNVDVPLAGLPDALQGFTIAQISDIHVGGTIKRAFVEAIVARVNGLRPDMVAITGDLVDGSVGDLARETAPLANLASRHGTYFVTGNHEYYFDPAHRSDPAAALHGAPSGSPKVLLAHQPRSAAQAHEAGFDLQLSGHTHGGQFWPWNFFVRLQQPFTAGLHRLGRMWVYVNRGTGYWGPPMRFGIPSEITRIRLVRA